MPRINIEVSLITNEKEQKYKCSALLKKETKEILYKEQDEQKTKVKFNYQKKELIRENKDLLMNYNFDEAKNTTGKILIKDLYKNIYVTIITRKIYQDKHKMEIDYLLEEEPYKYKIEVIR